MLKSLKMNPVTTFKRPHVRYAVCTL